MSTFKRKTFDNSYLFNQEANLHHKILTEFIIKADRIEDKKSDAFRGICEDVKRIQNSSVIYTVLMMDNVVLCMGKGEGLSRAFKVFEAKDLRYNREPKVFIDVTGIITFKDGYYICKKIDWLITYLHNALGYLLYSKSTMKLLNNSSITISATECFVSLFNYIPDYLRIIGYSQNKEKISYLAGLYFLHHMLGKDIDNYCKNIAAKVAGLSTSDTRAFELYYNAEEDFDNIGTFIDMISKTFKLKGLTVESFINKWMYAYGAGTYFASELLTSFFTLITSSYCGSYIVNQKQIERCCGNSEVKLCTALLQLGVSEFDNRNYMEASELDSLIARDKNTEALKESFLKREKVPEDIKLTNETLVNKSKAATTSKKMVEYFKSINKENKINSNGRIWYYAICGAMEDYCRGKDTYEIGVMEALIKPLKSYFDDKVKRELQGLAKGYDSRFMEESKKAKDTDKEKSTRCAKCALEVRKSLQYL